MTCDRHKIEQHLQLSVPNLYLFDQVGSTNEIVWELWEKTKQTPIIAIASQQTAGRGQWGRTWVSTVGGLYLSMGLTLNIPAEAVYHLTLWSGWGIAEELRRYGLSVKLKWPNDLILEGRKLGGIKSETRIKQGMMTYGVIGVGINWDNEIPQTGITLKSCSETHQIESLEVLAAITINGIRQGYRTYLREGIEVLLKKYLELLASVGRKVIIEGVEGTIVGVSTQGELKVCLQSPGAKTIIKLPPGAISLGYPRN
ncbi:MAG: biotin--[acetyl-CoA-carboxylase] ligase [Crocosphaera sp.]